MATAGQTSNSPELAQKLRLMEEKITSYDTTFGKIVALKVERDAVVAKIDKLELSIEQALSAG